MADTRPGEQDLGRHGRAVPGGTAALERTRELLRMVARNPKDVRESDVPYVLAVVANGVREVLDAVLRAESAGGTPEAGNRPTPESAAGRMADRPGEADALAVRKMLEWLASPPCRPEAPGALAALDRLTARLSETERVKRALVETIAQVDRAEARLSDYEQALRETQDFLAHPFGQLNPRVFYALRSRIEALLAARAALSGSTRPDEASV